MSKTTYTKTIHIAYPSLTPLQGVLRAPSDKSISHRALILASLAVGTSKIKNLLKSDDVMRTKQVLENLGVGIKEVGMKEAGTKEVGMKEENAFILVEGIGPSGLKQPKEPLYFGNSGTAARLVLGVLAGHKLTATLTGDTSLSQRPMERVTKPLSLMGASFSNVKTLPLTIKGTEILSPLNHTLKTPSAQIKSAILLAGLYAAGKTTIHEPIMSRDHTEKMLPLFGGTISIETKHQNQHQKTKPKNQHHQTQPQAQHQERIISLKGLQRLKATTLNIPSDPSSCAFLIVAALLVKGSHIKLKNVLLNKTRCAFLDVLKEMGALIVIKDKVAWGGDFVGTIEVKASTLKAVEIDKTHAPFLIDEYPILSIGAAFANGTSQFHGLGELRVKESDRLQAIHQGLCQNHVQTNIKNDTLIIEGQKDKPKGGGQVICHNDHRIAMSFLVMGLAAKNPISVDGGMMIKTSFPEFFQTIKTLGGKIDKHSPIKYAG